MTRPDPGRRHSVFLSYNRAPDVQRWVSRVLLPLLEEQLPHAGVTGRPAIFKDDRPDAIPAGDPWGQRIQDGVRDCSVLIAVLTPMYFQSEWCLHELGSTLDRQRRTGRTCVLPLRFSDGELFPPELRQQWLDVEPFDHLLSHRGHKKLLERGKEVASRAAELVLNDPGDPDWQWISLPRPTSHTPWPFPGFQRRPS